MKIKRYFAKDMRAALTQVKEELGSDAVIMSNKKTPNGVEIVAAIDTDAVTPETSNHTEAPAANLNRATAAYASQQNSLTNKQPTSNAFDGPNAEGAEKIASSLEEILRRQRGEQTSATNSDFANSHAMQAQQNSASQPLTNKQKSERATQALSQHAESEFEQWLNKARSTVEAPTQDLQSSTSFVQSANDQEAGVENPITTETNTSSAEYRNEIHQLKAEMTSIKELLEHQVSSLMWQNVKRETPTKAMLIDKLRGMGLSGSVSEQLAYLVDHKVPANEAWPTMLSTLTDQLSTTDNEIIKRGGIYSLVGPTGVGKTTTIAKLAARFAQIHGADKVGLITTDSFRIGALEQLGTYAKILGCPLKQAKDADSLSEAIYQMRDKKLVLIDTAGMSQRDLKLTEKLNHLLTNSRVNIKNYLVLSATAQMSVLQESVQHFKTIPLSGCIFTKIDESLSLGELISVAIHNRIPIGYLTNGQRVPEDIRVANAGKIVQKASHLFELKQKLSTKNNKVVPKAVGMYD